MRPSSYTTAGVLADWGIPAVGYGATRPGVHELAGSHVAIHTRGNIFMLVAQASSQIEIDDSKRDAARLPPRYAALVTPYWAHGRTDFDEARARRRMDGSASYGDICASHRNGGYMAPADSQVIRWMYDCPLAT